MSRNLEVVRTLNRTALGRGTLAGEWSHDARTDVLTPRFAIQCKLRRSLPRWLFIWMARIVETARTTGRTGALVLRTPGIRDADALAVMRLSDWAEMHAEADKSAARSLKTE